MGTSGGTATSGTDYTAPSGSVTIAAGDSYADVTIAVIDDSIAESTETVILNVTSSDDYVTGSGSATLFIWDNDVGTGSGVYYWTGATSTAWLDSTNWLVSGVIPSGPPGSTDIVYFDNSYATEDSILSGPISGGYSVLELHMTTDYSYVLSLEFPLSVGSLDMEGGTIDQPSSDYGSDLTVTSVALWVDGILNSTSNGANVIFSAATVLIAPVDEGTLNTASTIQLVSSSIGSVLAGTIDFNGGDGFVVNASSVTIDTSKNTVLFSTTGNTSGTDDKSNWIQGGGYITVTGPSRWDGNFLPLKNDGGVFTVQGGATAHFKGTIGPEGQAASVYQSSGTTVIENGSTIDAEDGVYLGGGKLSTAPATSANPPLVAYIKGNVTNAGAIVTIDDSDYSPPNSGHTFGTLSVTGDVTFTSGVYRPSVGWNSKGTVDNDIWNATGTFTITTGDNGAKLGPAPPVNPGTHDLTEPNWWVLYGTTGTTLNNNATSLTWELAAQGNDWENANLPNVTVNQLRLKHK